MFEGSLSISSATPDFPTGIDGNLWRKINAVLGESTRFSSAFIIEDHAPKRPVMVVVVERHGLPDDEDLRRRFRLTPRESEVARLLADRLSSEEIARRLGISLNTARSHCESVLRKLAIHSRNRVRTALLDPGYAPARRNGGGVA
jgi:DNA-binding CsgD family transcriptional regulator